MLRGHRIPDGEVHIILLLQYDGAWNAAPGADKSVECIEMFDGIERDLRCMAAYRTMIFRVLFGERDLFLLRPLVVIFLEALTATEVLRALDRPEFAPADFALALDPHEMRDTC